MKELSFSKFFFQIVRDTENSEELDHCTTESNMNYDDCFYVKNHEFFVSKFNCTFLFFVDYKNSSSSDHWSSGLKECKLSEFSKKEMEFLRSLIDGKILYQIIIVT